MNENTTDLLTALCALCACEVSVEINPHRSYYESVEDHLDRNDINRIDAVVVAEMVRLNMIVAVQAYPYTPVGFVYVLHWDLNSALRQALDAVREYQP